MEEGSCQLLQTVATAIEEEVSGLFGHRTQVTIDQCGTFSPPSSDTMPGENGIAELWSQLGIFLLGSTLHDLGLEKRPSWSKKFPDTHFLWAAQEVVSEWDWPAPPMACLTPTLAVRGAGSAVG